MDSPSNPELQDLNRQIDALEGQVDSLVDGLDDGDANWKPSAKRWSVAQGLDHLNAVCRLYFPDLNDAVESARREGLTGVRPPRRGWLGGLMIRFIEPPASTKLATPAPFRPADKLALDEVLERYRDDKVRLRRILLAADGLDLRRARMRMSAFKLIKLSLGDIFAFLLAHERRHLWQAEQVRAEPGFPATAPGRVAAE